MLRWFAITSIKHSCGSTFKVNDLAFFSKEQGIKLVVNKQLYVLSLNSIELYAFPVNSGVQFNNFSLVSKEKGSLLPIQKLSAGECKSLHDLAAFKTSAKLNAGSICPVVD